MDSVCFLVLVFRGFWTLLIIAALVSALTGGSLLICGVPYFSQKLYKVGGAFLIAAAGLFLVMLLLFVLWMEVVDVKRYILQEKGENCPKAEVSLFYGLSFMVAATGIPLEAVSGLLFLMCGRALEARR
ncbi:transmembrane protein 182-like [Cyprinodon tularosa]|uniref:transmembrane protein 182-like n=1 Tax=Cyprinodon tularosa TaxID=77115 RepID=UPI0018E248D2|nr:transmembrane protein 182-like [Cyprinodon tularosa]